MRRILHVLAWIVAALVALPVLAVGIVFAGLNMDPGRHLAERLIGQVTGGTVVVQGLSGRFPDHLRLARLELRDADGAWLTAEDAVLDWHPTALLRKQALIDRLQVARGAMPRLPKSDPVAQPAQPATSTPFQLPVRVTVHSVQVDRFALGQPVAGAAAVLALAGSADVASMQQGQADLTLTRLDGEGRYALQARLAGYGTPAGEMHVKLEAAEPAGGLVSGLASLPDLGAIRVTLALDGPMGAAATRAAIEAGPLRANATGTLDLDKNAADLELHAGAPAMQPRPDMSWQSVQLDARVHGPFTKPDATGTLRIAALRAAGAGMDALSADIDGNAGRVGLRAVAEGLRLPGPQPELFARDPLRLQAEARLDDPARPVTFSLSHPLVTAEGRATTGGDIGANLDLTVPQLAPFAAIGGIDLQGRTRLAIRATMQGNVTSAEVDGTVGVTGGLAPVPALLGPDAHLAVSAEMAGQDITLRRLQVDGRTLRVSADGTQRGGALDLNYRIGLSDLSALAATLTGAIQVAGRVQGPPDKLAVTADATGEVGAPGVPRGPVQVSLRAAGLPGAPTGEVSAQGTLAGAPLRLQARAEREADGTLHATIAQAEWRSARASGDVRLPPGATLPVGKLDLRMTRLDDLRPFVGQPVTGSIQAQAELDGREARLHLDARDAGIPGSRVGRAELTARIANPTTRPVVDAKLEADGIAAGGVAGSARVEVAGPQDTLGIRLTAALRGLAGADAQVAGAATLDVPGKRVQLASLQAVWKGETLRLLAPARVSFGNGVAVDQLRLGLRQAVLEAAGRLSPALDLTASLRNVTPDLARIVAPDIQADGMLNAEARLRGTPARPEGTVRVQATGLRMRTGPGRGLPPANLTATAQLSGGAAQLDARLAAGTATQVSVTGRAPLDPGGTIDLRASGGADLAVLDPILAAAGRRVRGRLTLNLGVAGTLASPRVTGTAGLSGGEVQDFAQGVRLDDMTAQLAADGQSLRVSSFSARAGQGTITASGTVGVLAPGLPLDLSVQLRNARPLSSDRLAATLEGSVTLRGQAAGRMAAAGTIRIVRAEIAVPENLPASIAVLDVRRPGERRAAPPAASGPDVDLDLTVQAPGNSIFVRGRGLDSVLGGELRVRGSAAKPQVGGGFEMRRGTISLAGTTLTFTRGKVGFDGTGPTGKIDPSLDFVAESSTSSVTARLLIGGYASAPKITLSSTPDLPQDEVLAYLLFKRSAKELGPFQLAEIAAALAQLTGVGGGAGNPLESVRKGLGLDRLSVGSSTNSNSSSNSSSTPTLEAGRYVANGVYVGAKQGTSGSETQATVQVDITKGLKVESDVGTGRGGNSVGLTYQFEW